jgi:xanthine dehydrogenase accessory factor
VIGDLVVLGETVGEVGGVAVRAGCAGLLRGLVHPDVELSAGEKVGDVDPRGSAVDPALISDKALAVAGGVLEGLIRLGVVPRRPPEESCAPGAVQR